jgi:hypothetical protein
VRRGRETEGDEMKGARCKKRSGGAIEIKRSRGREK